jgi:hypothetical protein
MMKAIVLVALGAIGYHLYADSSDREYLIYTTQSSVSTAAEKIADITKPSIIEEIKQR